MDDAQAKGSMNVDQEVRRLVYDRILLTGRALLAMEVADGLGLPVQEVRAAFQRMAAGHILVLQPASGEILMANPFSAVPTSFAVEADGVTYRANCIWDALGVVAMLKQDARIDTGCGDCNEAMTLTITDGSLAEAEGIIHFAVPARHWWDNIVFT